MSSSLPTNSYSWDKRMEVVSRFMLLGNMRVVSEQTGVDVQTLYNWKKSDWWPEMVETIRRQRKTKTNDSLTKIIETSLETVQERLENGDWVLNNKTGQIVRKPVSVKDANQIAAQLLQRQQVLEDFIEKTDRTQDTVQEVLQQLAGEFKRWNKTSATDVKFKEIPNALHDKREERLQEGSGEVHESSGGNSETSGAEQSSSDDGESR